MKVTLNYGYTSTTLDLSDKNYMGNLNPKKIKVLKISGS